jgi:hypothetical protein
MSAATISSRTLTTRTIAEEEEEDLDVYDDERGERRNDDEDDADVPREEEADADDDDECDEYYDGDEYYDDEEEEDVRFPGERDASASTSASSSSSAPSAPRPIASVSVVDNDLNAGTYRAPAMPPSLPPSATVPVVECAHIVAAAINGEPLAPFMLVKGASAAAMASVRRVLLHAGSHTTASAW